MHEPPGHDAESGLRFGPALMARLDALAAFTEVEGQLTRRYLSPAHVAAMRQVETWMAEAGLSVRTDPLMSLFGRYEGKARGAPAIMIGSHIDTVIDAGRYDGNLGVTDGGESGSNHRPLDREWVRELRDECRDQKVAFFFKQWGGRTPKSNGRELDGRLWDEYPEPVAMRA